MLSDNKTELRWKTRPPIMAKTHFSISVDIPAPPSIVWSVMTDLERWPEWTPSISRVKQLSPEPLQVGTRVRIHQPKLPPAFWRVTELDRGKNFTWVSVAPGVKVTARHVVEATAAGCRVSLSISYQGVLGRWLARWVGNLNERYLAMEANSLNARASRLAGWKALQSCGHRSSPQSPFITPFKAGQLEQGLNTLARYDAADPDPPPPWLRPRERHCLHGSG
jgi:uncharacterized membrane protein